MLTTESRHFQLNLGHAQVRAAYGEEGVVELALAMASARFFPVTKRALGYAVSCQRVDVRI